MIIDLRSDTVTRPTKGMMEAMMNAKVGDDVFSDDPTINALEEKATKLFGMEAAVFCPTGTMTNQIAVKVHTQPGEEVIIEKSNHVYYYEAGGIAFNSGCSVRLISGDRGRIKPNDISENINPENLHHPSTRIVCIENTQNRGGGSFYTMNEMIELSKTTHQFPNVKIHLDGARIFNALVELNEQPQQLGNYFDSISFCLSKGLGCPVGSVLLGKKDFIQRARKVRKVLGGGMRQAGFLAACGIYALDNHVTRLKEDHNRAKEIGKILETLPQVEWMWSVDTNIIIWKFNKDFSAENFAADMKAKNILLIPIGQNQCRIVTHLDFTDEMLEQLISELKNYKF